MHLAKMGGIEISLAEPRVILNTHRLDVAKRGKAYADIVEVRLDLFKNRSPAHIANELKKFKRLSVPLLATLRKAGDGGGWYRLEGSEEDRLACFRRAYDYVCAVDIEYNAEEIRDNVLKEAGERGLTRILSYHNFIRTETESRIQKTLRGMMALDADILKLAYYVDGEEDVRLLFKTLVSYYKKRSTRLKPISVIGMGPVGTVTRILFPLFGSCMTYGFLKGADAPKAPGQISVQALREWLKQVKRYGLPFDAARPSPLPLLKELEPFLDEIILEAVA